MTARTGRWLMVACFAVGSFYFGKAIYRGLTFTHGDFYFTLPGEYAQRLNPTLWNSPDVQQAIAYTQGTYLYGPTQYLALFPIVFLDSYHAIAMALLAIYPAVLLAAWYLLWKLVASGDAVDPVFGGLLFAAMFMFLPVTQALVQREFEIVALLLLIVACGLLVRRGDVAAGIALALLTWFKYWPIAFVAALALQRRWRALAAFAAASAGVLLAAQLVFGLQHFVIGKTISTVTGLVRPLGGGEVLYPVIPSGAAKSDFCRQWVGGRGTQADVRWTLCGLEDHVPMVSAKATFFAIVGMTAGLFGWGALRLERAAKDPASSKWSTIWELSILSIGGATFVHAHYYYLIVLLLPIAGLLYWYLTSPQPNRRTKLALWATAYLLLNALMLPTSLVSRMFSVDAWALYLDSGLCLSGLLLLLGLVLWEFVALARSTPHAVPA